MKGQWKAWQPGDPVLINRIVWDEAELSQMQEVLDNDWFGPGKKVAEFGKAVAGLFGVDYCQPVNSGSSALMLAVRSLINLGFWQPGDWILHPVCTFPTSIAPAIQSGLQPVFVDVDPETYQIDLDQVRAAIERYGRQIQGAIVPHLLGNICNLDELLEILGDRPLIEDCCDTLGGTYDGRHVGGFGMVAATSFYGSHHITAGGVGGALVTDNPDIYAQAKSMTHWGRNDYDRIEGWYEKFERRYWYETIGFDFQMTELQAAFALGQLTRLKEGNLGRLQRWNELDQFFKSYEDWFVLPKCKAEKAQPSWFGYPITIHGAAPFGRRALVTHLIENKIETRPLFTGNLLKHPAYQYLSEALLGTSFAADLIGQNAFFLPAWGMSDMEMWHLLDTLQGFLGGFRQTTLSGKVMEAAG